MNKIKLIYEKRWILYGIRSKGKLYDDEIGDMKAQSLSKIFTVKDKLVDQTATVYDDFIPVNIIVKNYLIFIGN